MLNNVRGHLEDVIDSLSVGLLVQDRKGGVLTANKTAADLLCVPQDDLVGSNPSSMGWKAIDLEGRTIGIDERPGRRCFRTGTPSTGHVLGLSRPDGVVFWIELDVHPLFEPGDDVPYAVVSTMRDVNDRVAAQRRVAQASRRNELVLRNSADGYRILDARGTVIEAYPPVGPCSDGADSPLMPFDALCAADRALMLGLFKDVRAARGATRSSDVLIETDSGARWFECSMTNYLDAPEVAGIVVNFRDVTARRNAERAMIFQTRLLDTAGQAIIATDERGRVVFWNQAAVQMYGWTEAEAIGLFVSDLVTPVESSATTALIASHVGSGKSWSGDIRVLRRDQTELPVFVTMTPVFDDDGSFLAIVGVSTDITERKLAEEELSYRAVHDHLTGLPNKVMLVSRLEECLDALVRGEIELDVLFVDVDRFKVINDGIGHVVGDQMLRAISERLVAFLPHTFIARFGGDEFVILDLRSGPVARSAADIVLEAFGSPFVVDGQSLHLSASIGVAHAGPHDTSETLLRDADAAMYLAKENGRAQSCVFDEKLRHRAKTRLDLETSLRRAIDREEFRVYYQPILALPDCTVAGFEALIRWQHPERGLIFPDEFISIAEETGLIIPIGEWVLAQAALQLSAWRRDLGIDKAGMAVNVSTRQILTKSLARTIEVALLDARISPGSLTLEITESSLIRDIEQSIRSLGHLKELGLHLALDDFGTGYSSLAYLRRLPVDVLKIDRSFVADLGSDRDDGALVHAITMLGTTLDLRIVAEGVETVDQLHALDELGCPFAQGYLWSRALPAQGMTTWLEHERDGNGSGDSVLSIVSAVHRSGSHLP
ncbi:MAG: diguanylate cyclase domain [Acidimicrobiales bacterium]|nr:diguanylate cyclase domain [Acidimicrobiales bacterium]